MKQPSKDELRERVAQLANEVARLKNELALARSGVSVDGLPAKVSGVN